MHHPRLSCTWRNKLSNAHCQPSPWEPRSDIEVSRIRAPLIAALRPVRNLGDNLPQRGRRRRGADWLGAVAVLRCCAWRSASSSQVLVIYWRPTNRFTFSPLSHSLPPGSGQRAFFPVLSSILGVDPYFSGAIERYTISSLASR